jgi:S1-C subfamily serine protease
MLSNAWLEAGPIAHDVEIRVQLPKQGSAAVVAGLVRGDVILAVEGHEIESLGDMQSAVRKSQPGKEIRLAVRRDSEVLEDVILVHS